MLDERIIWVPGGYGMLGSAIIRQLEKLKYSYVVTSSNQIDITDLDLVSDFVRKQKITNIINCAAYTKVDLAETEQKRAYLVNAIGPYNLAVGARRHGARVLHFSTDYVFDGQSKTPYTEESFCSPLGAYGVSKLAGEIKLMDELMHSCVIRTSWLFGLNGRNFVSTILGLLRDKEQLNIVSDQCGRPTYCDDLAAVALELMDAEGIFHFANSSETTWFHFAKEIHAVTTAMGMPSKAEQIHPILTRDYPTPAKRPAYSTLSTKKIEKQLGKVPRTWQEALKEYLMQCQESLVAV